MKQNTMDIKHKNRYTLTILCFFKDVYRTISSLCLFLFISIVLSFMTFAQEHPQETSDTPNTHKDDAFYFERGNKAELVFTQIIRWEKDEAVFYYEFTLKTADEQIIIQNEHVETNEFEVRLKPGIYFYKISAYNFLGVKETETNWIEMEIRKASLPQIQEVLPSLLYIDKGNFTVEVLGSGFQSGLEMYFTSQDKLIRHDITPQSISEDKIVFELTNPNNYLGVPYFLTVVDYSGLSGTSKEFVVKKTKPLDFYLGLSYTPWIPLYDSWFLEIWNKIFYPAGATVETGLLFVKTDIGFFGLELRTGYRITDFETSHLQMMHDTFLASLNITYEYWFTKKIAFSLFAGGGISYASLKAVFAIGAIQETESLDPMYTAGIAVRYKPFKYLYLDFGATLDQFFNPGVSPLGIAPEISIGIRY